MDDKRLYFYPRHVLHGAVCGVMRAVMITRDKVRIVRRCRCLFDVYAPLEAIRLPDSGTLCRCGP